MMAIANYEDRFVIPTPHREYAENAFDMRAAAAASRSAMASSGRCQRSQPVRRHCAPHHPHPIVGLKERSMQDTRYSLRALARLIAYPDAQLRSELDGPAAGARRRRGSARQAPRRAARPGHRPAAARPLVRREGHYVETFDRGRATSLHLFEHVHGDSRDRNAP